MRHDLPSGIVTFLFTDIEGSTRLLHELGSETYAGALAEHRRSIRSACARHGGVEVDTQGDAFFVAFPTPSGALAAASEATEAMASGPLRVRMGLHTGDPLLAEEGYVGEDVHMGARIAACAYGGQVVLSRSTRELVDDGFSFSDLGEHRLKDLEEPVWIFQLGEQEFPPLRSLSNTNLPTPASSFLGREDELAEAEKLLASARLLTVSGPGGAGKTRFAIELASQQLARFPNGVFWVPLAPLRDPELVLETVSQTIGARDGLGRHIGDKRLLLLLDNFEQVIEAARGVSELLSTCRNLTLLVTSRETLRVEGEVDYPLPPMPVEEGVELFCARTRSAPSNAVAELCARLDGLPLAIELAAARARILTPEQLLERLSERLDLLTGGRDADPRQQTLRTTIQWSYDLLEDEEARLFARLSVFSGGCTLDAAEEVARAELDTLQSLVEKSLVRQTESRFWMLETIREFAEERLASSGEADLLGNAHADHYVRWAEEAAPQLRGPTQSEWLPRVDAEHDNLRAAMVWSLDTLPELALRLGAALWRYWWTRSHLREGREWLERLRPTALSTRDEASVRVLSGAGALARDQGDWDFAIDVSDEAVNVARSLGDPAHIAGSQHNLAIVLHVSGRDLRRARALFEDSLRLRREIGDRVGVAQSLGGLSGVALADGDLVSAQALLSEALGIARELGDKESVAMTLCNLALLELENDDEAVDVGWTSASLRESLELGHELGTPLLICTCLEGLAAAERLTGNTLGAVQLLGAAAALREGIGAPLAPEELPAYERTVSALRAALDHASFERAWDEGRATPLEQIVEEVRR